MTEIRQLISSDIRLMKSLLITFGEVFHELDTYTSKIPTDDYLKQLLGGDAFIALVALINDSVVGGLTAYELKKYEQERSEIFIYDLAVAKENRREGIATALIDKLKEIASVRGAYVIFVQADTGIEDRAAIALYTKLGKREEVINFDIPVNNCVDTSK